MLESVLCLKAACEVPATTPTSRLRCSSCQRRDALDPPGHFNSGGDSAISVKDLSLEREPCPVSEAKELIPEWAESHTGMGG